VLNPPAAKTLRVAIAHATKPLRAIHRLTEQRNEFVFAVQAQLAIASPEPANRIIEG
jgi:hypothetical protein